MNSNEGFSLLEAVVSTAILGIACGALFTTSDAAFRTLERAQEQTSIAALLGDRLNEIDADPGPLPEVLSGLSTDGRLKWDQRAEAIKAADGAISGFTLQRVLVTATWVDPRVGDPVVIETRHLAVGGLSQ